MFWCTLVCSNPHTFSKFNNFHSIFCLNFQYMSKIFFFLVWPLMLAVQCSKFMRPDHISKFTYNHLLSLQRGVAIVTRHAFSLKTCFLGAVTSWQHQISPVYFQCISDGLLYSWRVTHPSHMKSAEWYLCWLSPYPSKLVLCSSSHNMQCQTLSLQGVMEGLKKRDLIVSKTEDSN